MFNKDFYPTPSHVIDMMGIDCLGKVVLEPSAGKGDIIDWLKSNGSKQVIACELSEDLAKITKTKAKFLKNDFLEVTPEDISHVDMVVMNPPFSCGVKHLLHAWEVSPDGCEIISLINWSNIENQYTRERRILDKIIDDYGANANLGNVFSDAERETDVEIGLIKLYKPKSNSNNEFEGFFLDEDEVEQQENGIMRFDAVRDVVQRYVYAVGCFEEHLKVAAKMNQLTSLFDVGSFSFHVDYNNELTTKEDFKKALQKSAWKYLFKLMNLDKYVTSGVMKNINKFVETQQNVPFTMKNIYKMFEIIVGTRENTYNAAIVEAIDNFTKHTHENRFAVEGWKTNSGYMLNKKFIVNYMVEYSNYRGHLIDRSSSYSSNISDLMKVLCSMTGTNFDSIPWFGKFCYENKPQLNTWYDWGFFEWKGFKKGTVHFKFKDDKVWELLNRKYAKIKGQVLPEKI